VILKSSNLFSIGVYTLLEKELKVLSDIPTKGTELLSKLSVKEEPAGKKMFPTIKSRSNGIRKTYNRTKRRFISGRTEERFVVPG